MKMLIMEEFQFIIHHAHKEKDLTPIFGISGTRASGKTGNVLRALLIHLLISKDDILIMRWKQNSISQSSYSELTNLIREYQLENKFKITNTYIQSLITGARIEFRGAYQQEDSIRSLSSGFKIIVLEECQEFTLEILQIILDTILRIDRILLIPIYNITDIHNPAYKMFSLDSEDPNLTQIFLTYKDNPFFQENKVMELQRQKAKRVLSKEDYLMHWEGIPKQTTEGCLYIEETLSKLYTTQDSFIPQIFEKVIISFDPAVSSNKSVNFGDKSNASGICVFGFKNNIAYLIDGVCEIAPIGDTLRMIDSLYKFYRASYIIYETNQGGMWIRDSILAFNPNLNVKGYTSTESKSARANKVIPQIDFERVKLACKYTIQETLINQMKRMTNLGFQKLYKNESPDLLDSFNMGLIDIFNLDKMGNENYILPPSQSLDDYFIDKSFAVIYKEKGFCFYIEGNILTKGNETALQIDYITQETFKFFSFDTSKKFDLLITNIQEFEFENYFGEKIYFATLKKSFELLNNLKNIKIDDNNFIDLWNRYDGETNDNIFLQIILTLMGLI